MGQRDLGKTISNKYSIATAHTVVVPVLFCFQTVEREKRVAFIGISNWALDPAKMNRGVMVTRGVPGLKELKLSALGICSTEGSDPVRDKLQPHFEPLSRAYMEICRKQERQFFGLRDYYRYVCVASVHACKGVCVRPDAWNIKFLLKSSFCKSQSYQNALLDVQ